MSKFFVIASSFVLTLASATAVPTVFFPSARTAYLTTEAVELAVADLAKGEAIKLHFTPAVGSTATPLDFSATGTGSTVTLKFPPMTFSPAVYAITWDDEAAVHPQKVTISSGVIDSTMLVSQARIKPGEGGGNFLLTNLFGQGLYRDGGPQTDFSTRTLSRALQGYNEAIAQNTPALMYMYWTGFVLHKPWGVEKSWANEIMGENMRLFSYHAAQALRRFKDNILAVGPLDEPGLAWGTTPAGGLATGFPNWDEQPWYEARGWKYTNDIGNQSAEDFVKYMRIRCSILGERYGQASKDIKEVWPSAVFGGDIYAVSAFSDGTNAMNQRANDVVTTHVFVDWGYGKVGLIGAIYAEKSHDPKALIAQATNGPLFGPAQFQPGLSDTYRMMMNAMVAAGLHSNWWVNTGDMKEDNLLDVNEPVKRLGPLFRNIAPANHDTAVLWSFTELANREKDIAQKVAVKKSGEQIQMAVAAYPEMEDAGLSGEETTVSGYSVSGNYCDQIIYTHDALMRAGYPTHIVHEDIVKEGALKDYKTLVIVGQTFELPADVKKALADFTTRGGKIIVDGTTTVKLPGAIVTKADFRDPYYRWGKPFSQLAGKTIRNGSKLNLKQASYYQTNVFMEEMPRTAVPFMKEAMAQTDSKPALVTDSLDLPVERHVGGEGAVYMVINGFQKLPEIGNGDVYLVSNYAPCSATFTLQGIPEGSAVYAFEGTDWKKVRQVTDFTSPQKADFAASEMKLYLVAPRAPKGLNAKASAKNNTLQISAELANLKMSWPLNIAVSDPNGTVIYRAWRATGADGQYKEVFPLGSNAPAGAYTVSITSPAGPLEAKATATFKPVVASAAEFADSVKVFDGDTITAFLKSKPPVTVAYGAETLKPAADKIAQTLQARGITATVKPEAEVFHKMRYPRVWDPFINVYEPNGNIILPDGVEVTQRLTVNTTQDGATVLTDEAGKTVAGDWAEQPGTLLTVGPEGFIDFSREQFYAPGCKILVYLDAAKKGAKSVTVVDPGVTGDKTKDADRIKKIPATPENREKWSRPWTKLSAYAGGLFLTPQLPEAYGVDDHLILLGDSTQGQLVAVLQASELLMEVADPKYPGPGKALLAYAWSPFSLGKNVIFIGASDPAGLDAGIKRLGDLAK